MEQTVLSQRDYTETKTGISNFGGDHVTIIGERLVRLPNDVEVEQYLYHIVGHTPENGQPFVGLKANIMLD